MTEEAKTITEHHHFVIYKPCDYISQFITNTEQQRKKKFLGELHEFPEGTMAIGRLDEHSEGLLLLTTSGKVSRLINGRKIEKEYYAQVDGMIDEEALEKLRSGVAITLKKTPYLTKPCQVELVKDLADLPQGRRIRDERHGPTTWVSITLTEGKYRQIRKMTAVVGFPTLRLVRFRVGAHNVLGMDKGEVIKVNQFKIENNSDDIL